MSNSTLHTDQREAEQIDVELTTFARQVLGESAVVIEHPEAFNAADREVTEKLRQTIELEYRDCPEVHWWSKENAALLAALRAVCETSCPTMEALAELRFQFVTWDRCSRINVKEDLLVERLRTIDAQLEIHRFMLRCRWGTAVADGRDEMFAAIERQRAATGNSLSDDGRRI